MTANWVDAALRTEPKVLWQPVGGYAIHLAEMNPDDGCAVADALSLLPAGEVLPLRRPSPPPTGSDATVTLAVAMAVLDEHDGGPMLLSRLISLMYQREPRRCVLTCRQAVVPMYCARRCNPLSFSLL